MKVFTSDELYASKQDSSAIRGDEALATKFFDATNSVVSDAFILHALQDFQQYSCCVQHFRQFLVTMLAGSIVQGMCLQKARQEAAELEKLYSKDEGNPSSHEPKPTV